MFEEVDHETFTEEGTSVDTSYTSAGGMKVVGVRNATAKGLLVVVASLRDVWPLKVPATLASHFKGLAPETHVIV